MKVIFDHFWLYLGGEGGGGGGGEGGGQSGKQL
jgi:hypothetical protein